MGDGALWGGGDISSEDSKTDREAVAAIALQRP